MSWATGALRALALAGLAALVLWPAQASAQRLTQADVFRFDLDDTIGGEVQRAFFAGITEYLADPGSLADILSGIEAARGAEAAE